MGDPNLRLVSSNRRVQYVNAPNLITSSRLMLFPVLCFLLSQENYWWALGLFSAMALTDPLDGWIARKTGTSTRFGAEFDALSDKVLIFGCMIFLYVPDETPIDRWMVALVAAREFGVTVLRTIMERRGVEFPAKWPGKVKVWAQCIAIGFVILQLALTDPPLLLTVVTVEILWVAMATTVASGGYYVWISCFPRRKTTRPLPPPIDLPPPEDPTAA